MAAKQLSRLYLSATALLVAASAIIGLSCPTPAHAQEMPRGDRMHSEGMHEGRGIGIGNGISTGIGIIQELSQQPGAPSNTQSNGPGRKSETSKTKRAAKKEEPKKKQDVGKKPDNDKPSTGGQGSGTQTGQDTGTGTGTGTGTTPGNPPAASNPPTNDKPKDPATPATQEVVKADQCPPVSPPKRREPWGNITLKNCCGSICPGGPSNQQIADMLYDGCDKAKKALSLLDQMLPTGRDGLKSTLTKAGPQASMNVDDLNGATSDSWNAVLLRDVLVKVKNRCENEFTLECETCKKGVPGNIYTYGKPILRNFSNIHICVKVEDNPKNWCTDLAKEQASSLLHEVTHLVGVDHGDKPFDNYQIADSINAWIPTLATAYDKLNPPPQGASQTPGQAANQGPSGSDPNKK
jgi:hypothetical protein